MRMFHCVLFCGIATLALQAPVTAAARAPLPLRFEPNVGQTDPRVRFLGRGETGTLFLTGSDAVLSLRGHAGVLRIHFDGASAGTAETVEGAVGVTNYFAGNDPAHWHAKVPNARRVRFAGIYPGVDTVWYGSQGSPEVDFVVAPGANPAQIALTFAGANTITTADSGDLVLRLPAGELRLARPVAYQDIAGVRRAVDVRYRVHGSRVTLAVAPYEATEPLVIDPLLIWSSFLGGSAFDAVNGVASSAGGDVFVTGGTDSSDFPGSDVGGSEPSAVFVSRISADGRDVLFTTILDGRRLDSGVGIAVDDLDASYVTGQTQSRDFPLVHAFESNLNHGVTFPLDNADAFVTKLDERGLIVYSTFLGGRAFEIGLGIAVDANHRAYAVGTTTSANFPLHNEFQSHDPFPGADAYLSVFEADGQSLAYSTFISAEGDDEPSGVAVDAAGNAYVVGVTDSTNLHVQGAFQGANAGGNDAWVAKINPAAVGARSLVYASYLGGRGEDVATAVAVDATGQAHVTGRTTSADFPIVAPAGHPALDATLSGEDAFVAKISARGDAVVFSTFLGGSAADRAFGIAVDGAGAEYVTGDTNSANFPSSHAIQSRVGGGLDAFVTKIDPFSPQILWSTLLGGDRDDQALGIALDPRANVALAGVTASGASFPTFAAFQNEPGSDGIDGFVARIEATPPSTIGVFRPGAGKMFLRNSNTTGNADLTVTLGQPGDAPVAGSWLGLGDRPGVFRAGTFILKAFNNDVLCCNITFAFGSAGDLPLAGDWDGDGIDTVGVFANGFFQLRNANSAGAADLSFFFGAPGDVPLAGDWDADGIDTIGVFRPSTGEFFLRNSNDTGNADITIAEFGQPGDLPVVGDWNGDGETTVGVLRGTTFRLRNRNTSGPNGQLSFSFGVVGDQPLAGDWDGRP